MMATARLPARAQPGDITTLPNHADSGAEAAGVQPDTLSTSADDVEGDVVGLGATACISAHTTKAEPRRLLACSPARPLLLQYTTPKTTTSGLGVVGAQPQ
jgi:hypothetical protein